MEMPLRVIFVLVAITALFLKLAHGEHSEWKAFQDLQHELDEEKNAQESLIAMLCDTSVHLAREDDVVIRSTPHFDNLVAHEAIGTQLKDYMPSDERRRFTEALARAMQGPVALPVTLLSKSGVSHQMHLFIVRRRAETLGAERAQFGFLVGVRAEQCSSSMTSTLTTVDMTSTVDTNGYMTSTVDTTGSRFIHDFPIMEDGPSFDLEQRGSKPAAELLLEEKVSVNASVPKVAQSVKDDDELSMPPRVVPGAFPTTAMVWIENCAVPRHISKVLPGDRILCYDSVGSCLAYSSVLTACAAASSHAVTVTLTNGSVMKVTADHPVAVRRSGNRFARQCIPARDLQVGRDSLTTLTVADVTVSSIEHHTNQTELDGTKFPSTENLTESSDWMAINVEKLGRYEILVASEAHDRLGDSTQAIAVGSCDRAVDNRAGLLVKNTFLCLAAGSVNQDEECMSAPPTVFRSGASDNLSAHEKSADNMSDPGSCASTERSSEMSVSGDSAKIKVGSTSFDKSVPSAVARLTDVVKMQSDGVLSMGSCHSLRGRCTACAFHFAYVRLPDTKRPCKASYLCEYCHDLSHHGKWTSKLRKMRPSHLG